MPYLFLGFAILVGLWLAGRWYVSAQPTTIIRALKWTGVIVGLGLILMVALTKQFSWLFFAVPAALPWLMRARAATRTARNWQRMAGGGAAGQSSQVETAYLRMFLDHSSGDMNGEVTQGRFRGRQLAELGLADLLALLGECQADEQSQQVLAAYLDRNHPDWRAQAQAGGGAGRGGSGGGNGPMSTDEAYEILGLQSGATTEEIKAAHHRLMAKIHPDAGGSTYLATKINQAKDLLLGE